MMEWAWTSQKIKWKGKQGAGEVFQYDWKCECYWCLRIIKDKRPRASRDKQKGRLGVAEDPRLGSRQKSSRGSRLHAESINALQVSKPGCGLSATMVCVPFLMAEIRSHLAAGRRTWFEGPPLLLFSSPVSSCHPQRGREDPALCWMTAPTCGLISSLLDQE